LGFDEITKFFCYQNADAFVVIGKKGTVVHGYVYRGGQILDSNNRNAAHIEFGESDKIGDVQTFLYDYDLAIIVSDKKGIIQQKNFVY